MEFLLTNVSLSLCFPFASCCYFSDKCGLRQMVRLSFLVPLCEFKDQLIKQGHFHLKRSVRGDFSPDRQCAKVLPVNAKAARHRIDLGVLGKEESSINRTKSRQIKVHFMIFW